MKPIDPHDYEFIYTKSDYNPNMGVQYWGKDRPYAKECIHVINKDLGTLTVGDIVRVQKNDKAFITKIYVGGVLRWSAKQENKYA